MKYHVRYQLCDYEGWSDKTFDAIEDVIAFLNSNATNPEFDFHVIHGNEIKFEPAEMVKTYRVKR